VTDLKGLVERNCLASGLHWGNGRTPEAGKVAKFSLTKVALHALRSNRKAEIDVDLVHPSIVRSSSGFVNLVHILKGYPQVEPKKS
jgi:hypothetical protein